VDVLRKVVEQKTRISKEIRVVAKDDKGGKTQELRSVMLVWR